MAQRKKFLPNWFKHISSHKSTKDVGYHKNEKLMTNIFKTNTKTTIEDTTNKNKNNKSNNNNNDSVINENSKNSTSVCNIIDSGEKHSNNLFNESVYISDDFEIFRQLSNAPTCKLNERDFKHRIHRVSVYNNDNDNNASINIANSNNLNTNNDIVNRNHTDKIYDSDFYSEQFINKINLDLDRKVYIQSKNCQEYIDLNRLKTNPTEFVHDENGREHVPIMNSSHIGISNNTTTTINNITGLPTNSTNNSFKKTEFSRNPSIPQVTSLRRDQSRASFRSKSVRDRSYATKKLRYYNHDCTTEPNNTHLNSPSENYLKDYNIVNNAGNVDHLLSWNKFQSPVRFEQNLYRVRSFKRTNKGVVNLGDTVRARSITGIPVDLDYGYRHLSSTSYPEKFKNCPERLSITELFDSNNLVGGKKILTLNEFGVEVNKELNCPGITLSREPDSSDKNIASNNADIQAIRIQVIGATNVGKTSLCRQLITSEFLGAKMESISEDTIERYVTVELDKQTWNLVLIDNFGEAGLEELAFVNNLSNSNHITHNSAATTTHDNINSSIYDNNSINPKQNDKNDVLQSYNIYQEHFKNNIQLLPQSKSAGGIILKDVLVYLIVYGIDDVKSYEYASNMLHSLFSKEIKSNEKIVILVANKSDLVRSRLVSTEKGKRLAHLYGCKYFEISTAINHLVDELLVEVVVQITQLRNKNLRIEPLRGQERRVSSLKSSGEALVRFICRQFVTKSCDSLHKS